MSNSSENTEAGQSGKGRPTPKRRDAEASRPRRSLAPAVKKADRKALKAQQRKKREELRGAYMRGEERALPTRDKGPARKFARKYVASMQDWKCGQCNKKLSHTFEVDHKIRLEHGGGNDVTNLVALCRECHGEKTAMENM